MKNFNSTLSSTELESTKNQEATPSSKIKIGSEVIEAGRKIYNRQKSKRLERFAYKFSPDSKQAKEHDEREQKLLDRRREGIEQGIFNPKDTFVVDPCDYRIISRHLQDMRNPMNMDMVASKYLSDGIHMVGEIIESDIVVYLDKSARPLDALARKVAKSFFPDEKMPKARFLNIDRQDIFAEIGVNLFNGWINEEGNSRLAKTHDFVDEFSRLKPSEKNVILASIRSQFLDSSADIDLNLAGDDLNHQIMNAKTIAEGKKIIVVDETGFSGATLGVSNFLLAQALPEAHIDKEGVYFWSKRGDVQRDKSGNLVHGTIPAWYRSDSSFGRGVGDRSHTYHNSRFEKNPTRANFLRKVGAAVISAPHVDMEGKYLPDSEYRDLVDDFNQLIDDYERGKVLIEFEMYDKHNNDDILISKIEEQAKKMGLEDKDLYNIRVQRNNNARSIVDFEFKKPI